MLELAGGFLQRLAKLEVLTWDLVDGPDWPVKHISFFNVTGIDLVEQNGVFQDRHDPVGPILLLF